MAGDVRQYVGASAAAAFCWAVLLFAAPSCRCLELPACHGPDDVVVTPPNFNSSCNFGRKKRVFKSISFSNFHRCDVYLKVEFVQPVQLKTKQQFYDGKVFEKKKKWGS